MNRFTNKINSVMIWNSGIILLILAGMLVILSITFADPDLWGHLKFGLDILETKSIQRVDQYSYLTSGQTWINHEWLAELLFALAWIAGGSTGLIILKMMVLSLAFGIAFWRLYRSTQNPIRSGVILILSLLMLWLFLTSVRPQVFTILSFGLILIIIVEAEYGNYRWLWAAPIITLLWVNLHGGFLAGIGILVLWALLHSASHLKNWRKFIPPILLSIIVTLANPYNIELITFIAKTATGSRLDIADWNPISIRSYSGAFYLLLLVLSILGLVFSRRKKNKVLVILFLIIAVLPLIAFRHLQLFSMAVLVISGIYIIDAWDKVALSSKSKLNTKIWFALIPGLAGLILIFWFLPRSLSQISILSSIHPYPYQTKELIKQAEVDGNLAILFAWGEYIIWHLGPEVKVSIDGRRETVYSDEIYQEAQNFHSGKGDWDAVLKKHDTEMTLVNKSTATYNLMLLEPNWELIFEDSFSALFAIRDSPISIKLQQVAADFKPPPEINAFP